MRAPRLRNLIITVIATTTLITGCLERGRKCPDPTVNFPIAGVITHKENAPSGCYMLHIKRDDNGKIETVPVTRYRYQRSELRQSVAYTEQPYG